MSHGKGLVGDSLDENFIVFRLNFTQKFGPELGARFECGSLGLSVPQA